MHTITKSISLWSSPWEISYACSSLFLALYFSIQGKPEIDIIFASWQEKKLAFEFDQWLGLIWNVVILSLKWDLD